MYNGLFKVLVAQSCPTLCYPMACGPARSSVHGILQGRILANVALPFSGGSSQPRDWTQVSSIAGRFFTVRATREAFHICIYTCKIQLQDVLIRCIHNKQTMNKSVSSPTVNGFQSMCQQIGVGWSWHSAFFRPSSLWTCREKHMNLSAITFYPGRNMWSEVRKKSRPEAHILFFTTWLVQDQFSDSIHSDSHGYFQNKWENNSDGKDICSTHFGVVTVCLLATQIKSAKAGFLINVL